MMKRTVILLLTLVLLLTLCCCGKKNNGTTWQEQYDLGVALATALMVALANDAPAGSYDHRADHGVGLGARLSATRQLQAAPHIQFVRFSLHSFLLLRG